MPISSAARGTYRAGGGRFARPANLKSSVSRSTPNLTAAGHHQNARAAGTVTPTRHDCGATRHGSYTFRARPMPNFSQQEPVPPGHARAVYRKNHNDRRPPYGVEGDVHQGVPFYPPSVNPNSPEARARLQRIRGARQLYKTPASRKATAGSVDDLLKATKPDRAPCSAVRHSQIHSERLYTLSASVPMHLHQLHHEHDHEHGHGGRRRRSERRGRSASNASGCSFEEQALGRRAVSSEVFLDDEASRVIGFTEGTQTDALSTDSLNDAAVMTDPEGLGFELAPPGISENRLASEIAEPFTLRAEKEKKREKEEEKEKEELEEEEEEEFSPADLRARAEAELEELRKIGTRRDRQERPCVEEDIAVEHVERAAAGADHLDAEMQRSADTASEPATSSVAAPSSILDSMTSEADAKALGAPEEEGGPRTMRADLTDLRHVEKRRSSLLKASGDDEDNEYFLLPGEQSISELLTSQDPMLDSRVAEWHHKSIFYQSKPIDGGADNDGIRVSAVQVSTSRVVRNPNAHAEPPELPVVVSSLTYPMRQLYPLPNSNHFLTGPGVNSPAGGSVRIADTCLVLEDTAEKDRLRWTVDDRRELRDGAMIPKEVAGDLQDAPDVIPRARSPLESGLPAQPKPQRPDHLNLVPNYPEVYLTDCAPQTQAGKPTALDFWRQREAAYMKRNALNTSVGHTYQ